MRRPGSEDPIGAGGILTICIGLRYVPQPFFGLSGLRALHGTKCPLLTTFFPLALLSPCLTFLPEGVEQSSNTKVYVQGMPMAVLAPQTTLYGSWSHHSSADEKLVPPPNYLHQF